MRKRRKAGRCPDCHVSSEAEFQERLAAESRRTLRSGRPVVVMTLRLAGNHPQQALEAACHTLRDTDWILWNPSTALLSVLCTETGSSTPDEAARALTSSLRQSLTCVPTPSGPVELIEATWRVISAPAKSRPEEPAGAVTLSR